TVFYAAARAPRRHADRAAFRRRHAGHRWTCSGTCVWGYRSKAAGVLDLLIRSGLSQPQPLFWCWTSSIAARLVQHKEISMKRLFATLGFVLIVAAAVPAAAQLTSALLRQQASMSKDLKSRPPTRARSLRR